MNVTEALLGIGLLFLFLVVLGVMREAVILRSEVTAFEQLITKPPAPSFIGGPLPQEVAAGVRLNGMGPRALIFLKDGCGGCDHLVTQIRAGVSAGELDPSRLMFVVGVETSATKLLELLEPIGSPNVLDRTGSLFAVAEVRGTPTLFAVWEDTLEVFDYSTGGDIGWLSKALSAERKPTTTS